MSQDEAAESDIFAVVAAREQAVAAELCGTPIHAVVGIVGASGLGGRAEKDNQWRLSFTLHFWRFPGGPMKERPLRVQGTFSREEFDSLWKLVEAYSVVRIRSRVVEDSVAQTPQAELVEFLGVDNTDAEMTRAAVDLQDPVILHDREFGSLLLDRRVDSYTAQAVWNGAAVWLNLSLDAFGAVEPALQVARTLWRDQIQWRIRVEDYAVQELLVIKNESWLDDGEAALTADQFKSRMTLESITVTSDGSFEFWHQDGDLFWGHAIRIGGSLSRGPTCADIPG